MHVVAIGMAKTSIEGDIADGGDQYSRISWGRLRLVACGALGDLYFDGLDV